MKSLIQDAITRRNTLQLSPHHNSFRLIDGFGDRLADLYLDQFSDHWLLSSKDGMLSEEFVDALKEFEKNIYWKKLDQHEKDSPSLLCGEEVTAPFTGKENGLNYELSFQSGYSQGIFLDQRENRARVNEWCAPDQRILNTFSYTGAFSVAAASAGATTTTLDLSQPYLEWAKRNMEHNDISPQDHYFCKGDTFHWLQRFAKSGRTFHGVILDPPTFSRDAKGKVFRVEKDYHRLVSLATKVLEPGGWILACSNCRKLSEYLFEEQILKGAGTCQLEHFPMPSEYSEEPYLKSTLIRL